MLEALALMLIWIAITTNAVLAALFATEFDAVTAPLLMTLALAPAVLLRLRPGTPAYRATALTLGVVYLAITTVIFIVAPFAPLPAAVAMIVVAVLPGGHSERVR